MQSFFCGKANLKNINQERSRKIPPCNHVFVIVLDSLGAAFGAAIKDAFFVVSVKQKRRVLLEVFYFFLYTGGKGGDAFETTGIQLFFKAYYAVVLR